MKKPSKTQLHYVNTQNETTGKKEKLRVRE